MAFSCYLQCLESLWRNVCVLSSINVSVHLFGLLLLYCSPVDLYIICLIMFGHLVNVFVLLSRRTLLY